MVGPTRRGLWPGYAFQAGEEELQFRERARQMMRPAINVWCGYQAVLAVCLALREVATGDLPAALLPLCPARGPPPPLAVAVRSHCVLLTCRP